MVGLSTMKNKRTLVYDKTENKRHHFVKIMRYLLVLCFLLIFLLGLYNFIKVKSFKFEFSQKYKCENSTTKDQTWLFVRVSNQELDLALIEEVSLFFVSDNFQKIYELKLDSDILLEDNTKYNKKNVIRVSDILIRSSTINESNNYLDSLRWYFEEIMSYRIDQVIVIPPSVYLNEMIELNSLNRTVFNWNWKNIILNGNELKDVAKQIYSTALPKQVIVFREKFDEYTLLNKKIIPDGTGEEIEVGMIYKYIRSEQWNDMLRSLEIYETLLLEQAQVEIYNASDIVGEGMRLSKWLKNLGIVVVRAENAPLMVSESCSGNIIYVADKDKYSESLTEVVDIVEKRFGNNLNLIYNRPEFVATGDIVIVLCEK